MKFPFLLLLCFLSSHAFDDNVSEAPSFIDTTHADFSAHIKSWGASIDDMVLGMYDFFGEDNETQPFDINLSYQQDTTPSWVIPIVDNNNSEQNTSHLMLNTINDINRSENNNTSSSFGLFLPSQRKEGSPSLEEAKASFFMYEITSFDKKNNDIKTDAEFTLDNKKKYEEIALPVTNKKIKNNEESIDAFFLTRKLLEERDRSYIRVSFLQPINSLGPDDFRFTVKARVHLTRSRKRLKLFIENLNDDSAKNIGKTGTDDSASIGLEQQSKTFFGIRPRYSIGFSGIDPFVRARYTFETDFGRWSFKPVQTFQYSLDDAFSEITELFLDTPTSDNTLLRFVADRGTNTNDPGMHYDGFVQWFYHPRKNAGLSLNLGVNGSTAYVNTITEDPLYEIQENRVFNYLFLLRWRENIWKKWLFYEVGPGLNYHEQYDYRPNYNIFFGIDMFFGHI